MMANRTLLALAIWFFIISIANAQIIHNPDFTQGKANPQSWALYGKQGKWLRRDVLEIYGHGSKASHWQSAKIDFTPSTIYRFHVKARRTAGSGAVIVGPPFANHELATLTDQWAWHDFIFCVPEKFTENYLRLGQWKSQVTAQFDQVIMTPALPAFLAEGELVLGDGESVRQDAYSFYGTFGGTGRNFHRTLHSFTAAFNTNRWRFTKPGEHVTYRFELPNCSFQNGEALLHMLLLKQGSCVVEVSADGHSWETVTNCKALGLSEFKLPEDLFPAQELFLRLRATGSKVDFQIDRIGMNANLDQEFDEVIGRTEFASLEGQWPGVGFSQILLKQDKAKKRESIQITVENHDRRANRLNFKARLQKDKKPAASLRKRNTVLKPNRPKKFTLDFPQREPARYEAIIDLGDARNSRRRIRAKLSLSQHEYYRTDYGQVLSGDASGNAVWWCGATRKIPQLRALPKKTSAFARLSAAKNDYEAVQIVVQPKATLQNLTASVRLRAGFNEEGPCHGDVEILKVQYHFIEHPTDQTGARDWWPDALPPLSEPISVEAGKNQPLWVLFHVAKDAEPGDYEYELTLSANGWSEVVPIKLHVWDFAIPDERHLETAFELSARDVFRYHRVSKETDRRRVLEMYAKSYAAHRISPTTPAWMDPIHVTYKPDVSPPRVDLDFTNFDKAVAHAFEKHHFTSLRVPVIGMGGGNFQARIEPHIKQFKPNTPQYQGMFTSYTKQVEDHLREKGWLSKAFVYWFDEPAPGDYAFVQEGMQKLQQHAPGLRRMLTEEPSEHFTAPVNLWCPLSDRFNPLLVKKHRARGEQFWWYLCTSPKAPYCAVFIDHPATDLRVWLWQTWQRDVSGLLMWRTNYWTSNSAYPKTDQNPYADTMSYVGGAAAAKDIKRFWGNGDGRFLYPPLSAFALDANNKALIFDPPVSSIRWEMLREGMEDYEYLWMLRDLLEKQGRKLPKAKKLRLQALLEVPESITSNMTTYTKTPESIYSRREKIAEAIESLKRL